MLIRLSLVNEQVGREVGAMLKRNTGLEVLDLRNNRLSKAGIQSIAESLQVCSWPLHNPTGLSCLIALTSPCSQRSRQAAGTIDCMSNNPASPVAVHACHVSQRCGAVRVLVADCLCLPLRIAAMKA